MHVTVIVITLSNTVHCAKLKHSYSWYRTWRTESIFLKRMRSIHIPISVSVVTVVWHSVTIITIITTITRLKRLPIQLPHNTYTGPTPMLTVCKCRISSLYAYCPISNIYCECWKVSLLNDCICPQGSMCIHTLRGGQWMGRGWNRSCSWAHESTWYVWRMYLFVVVIVVVVIVVVMLLLSLLLCCCHCCYVVVVIVVVVIVVFVLVA